MEDKISCSASLMEEIVENFLIKKLDQEIKKIDPKKLPNCKILLVHEECRKLMELIREIKGSESRNTRKEKLYFLLNIMAEWLLIYEKQSFINPASINWANEASRRMKQIEKELKELHKSDSARGAPEEDKKIYKSSSHASTTEFHGFKDKGMVMQRLLTKKGSKVIGITGVAGVGKTALCQQAFNNGEVQKHFPIRIWLCLSKYQQSHAGDQAQAVLMKTMMNCLGFEDEVIRKVGELGLDKLKATIKQQLKRGKYLIVLDDAWITEEVCQGDQGDAWITEEVCQGDQGDAIELLFKFLTDDLDQSGYEGTVILTSRSGELEKKVRVENLNRLKLLQLEEMESCWKIFTDAGKGGAAGEGGAEWLSDVKKDIVINCQNLPLMAKMMGQSKKTDNPNSAGTG